MKRPVRNFQKVLLHVAVALLVRIETGKAISINGFQYGKCDAGTDTSVSVTGDWCHSI